MTLYTTIQTPPIYHPLTILDVGLAAGMGALVAVLSGLENAKGGAAIGVSLRLAYKINEMLLNPLFSAFRNVVGPGIGVSLTRKAVEVIAAAALTEKILPQILQSTPLPLSTYLLFSALENTRFIRLGGFQMSF